MSLYVTVPEFKQSPTAIDTSQLDQTAIGVQAAQDNALLAVLRRASAWVDQICRMPSTLEATVNTETKRVHIGRQGIITVHVNNAPIVNLQTVQYRLAPNMSFVNVDLQFIQQFESWFEIYNINSNTLSPALTLQANAFGYFAPYRMSQIEDLPVTLQYTYVNGYANTTLNGAVDALAQTITVNNVIGFTVGEQFTIYDVNEANTEYCTVQSINGNVITLTAPLVFPHTDKTAVSAIPDAVKQATILLAGHLIKNRGGGAVVMTEMGVQGVSSAFVGDYQDVKDAKELLEPHTRVITS